MKIVIVESHPLIQEELTEVLHKMSPNYEVAPIAKNAREGYDLVCQWLPDLVILDTYMQKGDGLTILRKLRRENNMCKVLVLSEHPGFEHIKQAMELDAENYLLKPVKIQELKRAVQKAEKAIEKEQSLEKVFTVPNILLSCLNGQLMPDRAFNRMTMEKFGFSVENSAEIFILWLGNKYKEQNKEAKNMLLDVKDHAVKFESCVLEADAWDALLLILYHNSEDISQYLYFKNSVVPMLCDNLREPVICVWSSLEKILDLPEAIREMQAKREWNLLLGKGALIRKEDIEKLETVPIKYPTELEYEACKAVKQGNKEILINCYKSLFFRCREEKHKPGEIKAAIIRFNWSIANCYGSVREINAELQIQKQLQAISEAVSWSQIDDIMESFFEIIDPNFKDEKSIRVSKLVQKALHVIQQYYDQGITLEEVADKPFVSEEYLSTQIKKQTGATFSETIRELRIEKVKSLLRDTHLKLGQISELAGYSDPKYMSRVFKEEVGMLPSEFRKSKY
ncbi:response regulator transcription factor [Clostridium sp. C105KSO13]|uniref:response regulator transcription factor n=1 Tax=Clostridium sp. C105KSO13 TaxID=1776045 RepID=UPI0007407489|nr:response regulator [Clostridium sp. C105KSO13]CUX24417.1 HTH-type transcriptional regulator YesS [Clostridium sp. C105KSO13]